MIRWWSRGSNWEIVFYVKYWKTMALSCSHPFWPSSPNVKCFMTSPAPTSQIFLWSSDALKLSNNKINNNSRSRIMEVFAVIYGTIVIFLASLFCNFPYYWLESLALCTNIPILFWIKGPHWNHHSLILKACLDLLFLQSWIFFSYPCRSACKSVQIKKGL